MVAETIPDCLEPNAGAQVSLAFLEWQIIVSIIYLFLFFCPILEGISSWSSAGTGFSSSHRLDEVIYFHFSTREIISYV